MRLGSSSMTSISGASVVTLSSSFLRSSSSVSLWHTIGDLSSGIFSVRSSYPWQQGAGHRVTPLITFQPPMQHVNLSSAATRATEKRRKDSVAPFTDHITCEFDKNCALFHSDCQGEIPKLSLQRPWPPARC